MECPNCGTKMEYKYTNLKANKVLECPRCGKKVEVPPYIK